MNDFDKLVDKIMKEFASEGEPVTREEAEEIAKLEVKAKANDKRYEQSKPKENFNVSEFLDYSIACHNLKGRLVNTEKNRELLKELPHRNFFDLSLIYFVDVTRDGDLGCASIRVTNDHIKMWNVTEEDLYRQFKENMEQDDRSKLQSIIDVLAEGTSCLQGEMDEVRENMCMMPMYVLSNTRKLDGAVEILNNRAMEKAAETIGDDFYILPSSIHETILPVSAA